MIDRLLPARLDDTYRGQKIALWLFGLLVFMKAGMAVNSIFNGYFVATSADGMPLDTFAPAATQAVVSLFAAWGLGQLMISLVCVLVLVRYRSGVPFMFALLLLEHASRALMFQVIPIDKAAAASPASVVNVVLYTLEIGGLALSLWTRGVANAGSREPVSTRA